MSHLYDSIVIGAGPAGMTAALYLARANCDVLLLEGSGIGGQIAISPRLENYPSIPSISGEEFADRLFSQITDLGVEFDLATIVKLEKEGDVYTAIGDGGERYLARTILLCAGCKHRKLSIPGEKELTGKGVSYCAACDGAFFQGEKVLVIGDGNTALQYAINLSNIASSVEIVTLFDRYFADPVLVERLSSLPNVTQIHGLSATAFLGEGELTGVEFEDTKTKTKTIREAKGVFVAIGQIPNNEPFLPFVDLEDGFILASEEGKTKSPGLFAAGDCRVKKVRQVATAIGDGANAAMSAIAYLDALQS